MSSSAYDNLRKHLHNLRMTHSHIRHDLRANSNALTKLEMDASHWKDRLAAQLQHASVDDCLAAEGAAAASAAEVFESYQTEDDQLLGMESWQSDSMENDSSFLPNEDEVHQNGIGLETSSLSSDNGRKTVNGDTNFSGNVVKCDGSVATEPAENVAASQSNWLKRNETVDGDTEANASVHDLSPVNVTPANAQNGSDGPTGPTRLITIATQTTDVFLPSSDASIHDGLDWLNAPTDQQNASGPYHDGWTGDNGLRSDFDDSIDRLICLDTASIVSFNSSNMSSVSCKPQSQQLGPRLDLVCWLLSALGTHDKDDTCQTLLAMSNSQDSCIAMRQCGCIPLLIQLIHGYNKNNSLHGGSRLARGQAADALRNIVRSNPDNKNAIQETHILHLLEQIRAFCDQQRYSGEEGDNQDSQTGSGRSDVQHLFPVLNELKRLCFDEEHRQVICNLGGLPAIAELLELDQELNGNTTEPNSLRLRVFGCMILVHLTFGDSTSKALMCSYQGATRTLVAFLQSPDEELCRVAADVLRNVSWSADTASKQILQEVGSAVELMRAAMRVKLETTLKSILSALWNVSAHSTKNREDICAVEGALKFLVGTLTFKSQSKTLTVIESGGGILRVISSQIAVREDYRVILRKNNCIPILLRHLESSSLKIVENACGTLWNISARCAEDQRTLLDLGAVSKLHNLMDSKHRMISAGSRGALRNLHLARQRFHAQKSGETKLDGEDSAVDCKDSKDHGSQTLQSQSHDLRVLPKNTSLVVPPMQAKNFDGTCSETAANVGRSESEDSIASTHSDISHNRARILKNTRKEMSPGSPERPTNEKNKIGSDIMSNSQKHGYLVKRMHEAKFHGGVLPQDSIHEGYFVAEHQQSPAALRRQQAPGGGWYKHEENGARGYTHNPAGFVGVRPAQGRENTFGKRTNQFAAADEMIGIGQLTPCMEKLHLTMPELDQDLDEPINFSNKYVEEVHESSSAASAALCVPPPVTLMANRSMPSVQCVNPSVLSQSTQNHGKMFPVSGVMPGTAFSGVRPVRPGRLNQPVASCLVNPGCGNDVSGFTSKGMFVRSVRPTPQGKATGGFSLYNKPELDLELSEQPTNYSIQFAERNDEDDESTYLEQPVNYSIQYKEREMSNHVAFSLPPVNRRSCEFNDDTVTTFCTEGTPMNFLSTATSMNDLTCKGASAVQRKPEASAKMNGDVLDRTKCHSEAECSSVSGSQSTDRNPASTVVLAKRADDGANRISSTVEEAYADCAGQPSHLTSTCLFKDGPESLGSYDKPKQYCTEGTPVCFSGASSMSNLQMSDALVSESPPKRVSASKPLPNVDEKGIRIATSSAETKQPKVVHDGAASASVPHNVHGGTKTVTFDDNNQIQETPLMFSRCSSLGSLSSFETHSVHSSVVSEYSRRASEVVSPSDLPDSPCDTMPPSPSYKSGNNAKYTSESANAGKMDSERNKPAQMKAAKMQAEEKIQTAMQPLSNLPLCGNTVRNEVPSLEFSAQSSPVVYADEGSLCHFSARTSLSALTIDEDVEIPVKIVQKAISFNGNDQVQPEAKADTSKPDESEVGGPDVDDDDDSSVSEGEANLLAECISRAMPSKSSKRLVQSSSDGLLKKHTVERGPPGNRQTSCVPGKVASGSLLGAMSGRPLNQSRHPGMFCAIPEIGDNMMSCDSPKNYATEDTPLNFSHSGSLGDLTSTGDFANGNSHFSEQTVEGRLDEADDDNFDVISLSDSSDALEGLLSQVINAAMPKSKKQSNKNGVRREEKRAPKPTGIPAAATGGQVSSLQMSKVYPVGVFTPMLNVNSDLPVDGIRTYAVEGTPLEFSRSTSLSNLTIESGDGNLPETSRTQNAKPQQVKKPTGPVRNPSFPAHNLASEDTLHSYMVEGTPAVFSRNDSLSSLSEAGDHGCEVNRSLPPTGGSNVAARFGRGNDTRPQNSQKTMETGNKLRSVGRAQPVSGVPRPRMHNMDLRGPRINPALLRSVPGKQVHFPLVGQEDQVVRYAVEGTPENVSRNLSPTSSHRYPVSGARGNAEFDQSVCFQVEDTPAQFSCNSSLSSLSLESFQFEPTPSDEALLLQCIKLGMPKSKRKTKKPERQPAQTSPQKGPARQATHQEYFAENSRAIHQKNSSQPWKTASRSPAEMNPPMQKFDNKHSFVDSRTQFGGKSKEQQPEPPDPRLSAARHSQGMIAQRSVDVLVHASMLGPEVTEEEPVAQHSSSVLSDPSFDDDIFNSGTSTDANNTVIYRDLSGNKPDEETKKDGTSSEHTNDETAGVACNDKIMDETNTSVSLLDAQGQVCSVSFNCDGPNVSLVSQNEMNNSSFIEPVKFDSVQNSKPLLTKRMIPMCSTPKGQSSVARTSGNVSVNNSRISTSTGRRSPAGKSRSLSPAVRSHQSGGTGSAGTRASSRSSSTHSRQVLNTTSDKTCSPPGRFGQKPAGVKVSPQTPPRTSSQLSTKSSTASPVLHGSSPASRSGSAASSLQQKSSAPSRHQGSASFGHPIAKTTGSGIPRKVETPRLAEKSEPNSTAAAAGVDRPRPPTKQNTFTKPIPAVGYSGNERVRSEGVGGCDPSVPSTSCSDHAVRTGDRSVDGAGDDTSKLRAKDDEIGVAKAMETAESVASLGSNQDENGGKNHSGAKPEQEIADTSSFNNLEMRMPSRNLSESQPSMASILTVVPARKSSLTSSSLDGVLGSNASDPSVPQKKQGFSRLSSFWLRDKKSKDCSDKSTAASESSSSKKTGAIGTGKSPKSFRKSFPVGRSRKMKKADTEPEELSSAAHRDGIIRSCTYDKILEKPVTPEALEPVGALDQDCDSLETKVNLWRRTYTVESKGEDSVVASDCSERTSKTEEKEGKKSSLSIFKRLTKEKSKDKSKDSSKHELKDDSKAKAGSNGKLAVGAKTESRDLNEAQQKPAKKKGFSLFRKDDSHRKNKGTIEIGTTNCKDELVGLSHGARVEANHYHNSEPRIIGGTGSAVSTAIPPSNHLSSHSQVAPKDKTKEVEGVVDTKHGTKTEMLLARRSQATKSVEHAGNGEAEGTVSVEKPCIITTV